MANDITVNITDVVILSQVGFGTPLIAASKQSAAIDYTECTTLAEVATEAMAAHLTVLGRRASSTIKATTRIMLFGSIGSLVSRRKTMEPIRSIVPTIPTNMKEISDL